MSRSVWPLFSFCPTDLDIYYIWFTRGSPTKSQVLHSDRCRSFSFHIIVRRYLVTGGNGNQDHHLDERPLLFERYEKRGVEEIHLETLWVVNVPEEYNVGCRSHDLGPRLRLQVHSHHQFETYLWPWVCRLLTPLFRPQSIWRTNKRLGGNVTWIQVNTFWWLWNHL